MARFQKHASAALALALVATIAPLAAADVPQVLSTMHVGSPGDATWQVVKLQVTQQGATPSIHYEADKMVCPMEWGAYFMTGTAPDVSIYNSVTLEWDAGDNGVATQVNTPVFGSQPTRQANDGADHCLWSNLTVIYHELPLGTVYVLMHVAGGPFVGQATLMVDGPGVTVVGLSQGTSSFYHRGTDMAGGVGATWKAPPWCGELLSTDMVTGCPDWAMNEGGDFGASVLLDHKWAIDFNHHPFYVFEPMQNVGVSNASVLLPDGTTQWPSSANAVGPTNVGGTGIQVESFRQPSGHYVFQINENAGVGIAGQDSDWVLAGADIQFPEEQA